MHLGAMVPTLAVVLKKEWAAGGRGLFLVLVLAFPSLVGFSVGF